MTGGPFWNPLRRSQAGFAQPGTSCPRSVMSDPLGGYMEIGEVKEEEAGGIRVELLNYNDPSETYSTYLGSNFDEAYQRRFGRTPGSHKG